MKAHQDTKDIAGTALCPEPDKNHPCKLEKQDWIVYVDQINKCLPMLKMTNPSSRRSCSPDMVWHHHPSPCGTRCGWDGTCTWLAKGQGRAGCCGPECGPWWVCKAGNMHYLGRKDAGGLLGETLQRGCVWQVPPGTSWRWALEIRKCLLMVCMSSIVVYLLNYIDPECAVYWLLVKYVPLIIQKTAFV